MGSKVKLQLNNTEEVKTICRIFDRNGWEMKSIGLLPDLSQLYELHRIRNVDYTLKDPEEAKKQEFYRRTATPG